ncbi:FHA domain-containing protein [Mycobacterium sp. 852014-50255_SCH5639931]|uniref:FHA domain-containing protein n=1 Tax=Mycobacterium sp. 852014-50255_SCH5639931 TaxID=1834112 RepID=UPI0009ED9C31|nr:FHA domain-containing protein [Mycobacterium sp. 852014-50255_SCH5639931]
MTSGQPTTALTVRIGHATHTLHPAAGVAVIGRDAGAAVQVDDERVSRWHVRLEPHRDGWHAFDTSGNGMFVDGIRRNSVSITGVTTICLGAPDGAAVTLIPQRPSEVTLEESTQVVRPFEAEDEQWWDGQSDPGVIRAGSAVAERRQQLGISQRSLDRDGIINAGALINFEKGRSWPRRSTLERLEKVLEWPTGHITRIRRGAVPAPTGGAGQPGVPTGARRDEATEVLADSIQAPLMAETVELAMHTLTTAVSGLPEPADPDFTPRATNILADLRKLERLASSAARNAKGSPSVILALSSVRRSYNDLMMRAARSPAATLGQRLYGARHRAELSLEEAANGAGLPASVLEDAEAERTVAPEAARAIENLIAQLPIG